MKDHKLYIAIGAIGGFIVCLLAMQTINTFNSNQDRIQKLFSQLKQEKFFKYFATEIPPEWGSGKTDPYSYSELDADPTEQQIKEKEKETENAYEKHYQNIITREELGNHGWTLLHMISSTYPLEVSDPAFIDKTNLFINLFGQFYPCKVCSKHFLEMTSERPFTGKGRKDFMMYLCQLHNTVNKRLEKEEFDCSKLEEKWGGNCGCNSKDLKVEKSP